MVDLFADILLILETTLRTATPMMLAALAGLISERAGVVDISLEGKMLLAAFAAGAVAFVTGSVVLGIIAALMASVLLGLVHGYVSIHQRGNQIVSSMALNIIAAGLAPTLAIYFFHRGGQTPFLQDHMRMGEITLPFADTLGAALPIIGPLYRDVISGHSLLSYAAFAAVPLTIWLLYRSSFGLRLRAVGENPEAVDTAGISVYAMRYKAVLIAGLLCGFAGAFLALGAGAPNFIPNMTGGRGYLALAAMIFGRWKPVETMLACLLFGFVDALQGRLQGVDLPLIGEIPVQFTMMLPYILTVVILAGFVGQVAPPRASGLPYEKDK